MGNLHYPQRIAIVSIHTLNIKILLKAISRFIVNHFIQYIRPILRRPDQGLTIDLFG